MQAPSHRMGLIVAALIAVTLPSNVQAAELKVSGTVTYVTVSQETSKVGDRSILHLHDKGIVRTEDDTSLINGALTDCFDTILLGPDGGVVDGAGYCDTFDKDGDAYWFTWTGTGPGSTWTVYHGTGKFEGLTGGGGYALSVNLPDRYMSTFEGSLSMK